MYICYTEATAWATTADGFMVTRSLICVICPYFKAENVSGALSFEGIPLHEQFGVGLKCQYVGLSV